jgi:hypothetical protein
MLRKKMKENNIKPDWITQEQWKNVPSVQWWVNQKQGEIYIKQLKPVTAEEAIEQMVKLRQSANWNNKQ